MRYCPKCKSLMMPKNGKMVCVKCGHSEEVRETTNITVGTKEKEIVIVDSAKESISMPQADILCPSCGNTSAYWRLEQTRAADEPTTRIYTCTKCKHTWREYS